jgi:lipopolysaccharide/colanic/teichoic acid biosynthesis glycosyltransferase
MRSQHHVTTAGSGLTRSSGASYRWYEPAVWGTDVDASPKRRTHRTVERATRQVPPRIVDEHELSQLAESLVERRPSAYERRIKPVIDRAAAAILLTVFLPVLLTVYVAVLITVGRPVLFRQVRVGKGGRAFDMLKFRTMRPDRRVSTEPYHGHERRVTHKSASDPRHTRLGRLLRKTSLDELPQLLNVVRGQMSLVGPRPELLALVEEYTSWQRIRHIVKPGLTGLWQTTERGKGRLLHECVDLDLQYISRMSFKSDVAILLRTPMALLKNKGVI